MFNEVLFESTGERSGTIQSGVNLVHFGSPLSYFGNSFSQIDTVRHWSSVVSATPFTIMLIKNDGTLHLLNNASGGIGLPDGQVGSDTNWVQASCMYIINTEAFFAIKSTGTLWSFGNATNSGVMGQGNNTTTYSSPTQVGSSTLWSKVCAGGDTLPHVLALRTDGTLWSWGDNTVGQLGYGSTGGTHYSPAQVGLDTNWSFVACGDGGSFAIKTNGTLWSWGLNSNGQLGQGDTTNRSTPTQIGTDTNWASISTAEGAVVATKTTGTLWAWGDNTSGTIGNGTTGGTHYSPVQVGSDTNWATAVIAGQTNLLAVKTNGTLHVSGIKFSSTLTQYLVNVHDISLDPSNNSWVALPGVCQGQDVVALKKDFNTV